MPTHTAGIRSESNQKVSLTANQRLLLGLLKALGGSIGNLDFQKALFLYCQEPDSGKPYDFVPYKQGAFSFTSYADRRKLIAHRLLEDDDRFWRFTEEGRDLIEPDIMIVKFVTEIGNLRGDDLVAETYRRFPYYASKSEIAHRVLKGDYETLEKVKAFKQTTDPVPLQTIGYEGHSLENYLNLLLKNGVTLLCDARRNPLSRKYGFSKNTLSNACHGIGIRYEHLPELGISSDKRTQVNTPEDHNALLDEYEREWLPLQTDALKKVQGWIEDGERVVLTCYEHAPDQCHRSRVSKVLETMFQNQLRARHL